MYAARGQMAMIAQRCRQRAAQTARSSALKHFEPVMLSRISREISWMSSLAIMPIRQLSLQRELRRVWHFPIFRTIRYLCWNMYISAFRPV